MVLVDRAEKRSRNPRRDEKWMAGLPFSIRHNQSEADVHTYIYIYAHIYIYTHGCVSTTIARLHALPPLVSLPPSSDLSVCQSLSFLVATDTMLVPVPGEGASETRRWG